MRLTQAIFALCLVLTSTPACLGDDLADGKKIYNAGDYNKAAQIFQKAISKNSQDATAHYYLANCYVAKRDFAEARSEYQYAANLTKDQKVRTYCLALIDDLENRVHPHRSSAEPGADQGISPTAYSHPTAPPLMSESGQQVIQGSSATAAGIMADAERQCQKVMAEKNAALAPMTGTNRFGTPFSSDEERQYVAEPYDKRIAAIRAAAKVRADDVLQQGKADARRVSQ